MKINWEVKINEKKVSSKDIDFSFQFDIEFSFNSWHLVAKEINYKNEILTLTQLCEKINIKYCNVSSYICRYRNNKNTNELILDYLKLIKKEIDINE